MIKRIFNSLEEMYSCREWEYFISDKLGNNLFMTDPDRAERLQEAAESGADGSTHAEVIADWREFLNQCRVYDHRYNYDDLFGGGKPFDITQATYNRIEKEINDCEEWHLNNGSLDQGRG